MKLKGKTLRPWSRDWKLVKGVLKSQIPKEELLPFIVLRWGTLRKDLQFTCFYDGDRFAGVCCVELGDGALFLLYLAVNPDVQSRGYGTAILRALGRKYAGWQIDMHIEVPKDLDSINEQAARRYRFYERAGYRYTGWMTEDDGVQYWILSNRGVDFDQEKHKQFLEKDKETGEYVFRQG